MNPIVREGGPAPSFALPTASGEIRRLRDFQGKPLVLYFYPKDDTPGCTKEACAFRDLSGAFRKAGAEIVGVSLDSEKSHAKFTAKYGLPFPLLSDADAAVSKAYGVYKEKMLYGRKFWGIERTTFLVGPDGRLLKIYPKVRVEGHPDEVLADLSALRSAGKKQER